MWCSTCQQDVPGISSPAVGGALRCSKCGSAVGTTNKESPARNPFRSLADSIIPETPTTAVDNAALERILRGSRLTDDDWALEAELRGIQRMVATLKSQVPLTADLMAVHAPHRELPARHSGSANSARRATAESTVAADERNAIADISDTPRSPRSHTAAWIILSLGLAVFACGAMLLGWSLVAQREDLWPVGMPLALIGQAGLILGLILQLDGLWHTSRNTTAALSELDGELKRVRQATTLLSTSHAPSAQSFYVHLAEGATPQLLLADLKGQIDLLAQQMARQTK
jgi:hypothetical protein